MVAAVLLLLAGCDDPSPLKVGFIGGLSGRSADIGEASRNAVQLAVDEVNRAGGIAGRRIELLVRDDANDPEIAAEAVRGLHGAGVDAIIGPNISAIAAGMLPAVNELSLVTISPTVSALSFADIDDYLFRINWTTRDNAVFYAQHYLNLGYRRIAAAIDNNNRVFSESWMEEFAEAFEAGGGTLAGFEVFEANGKQGYAETARGLLARGSEALLLVANSVDTAQLAQQIRKIDPEILLIAAEWAASDQLISLGGRAIEGLELVQSYDRSGQSDRFQRFREAYRKQFQQEPDYSSVAAYDAATMLFAGFAKRSDEQTLKESLLSLGEVEGLQQGITFNRYGDAQRRAYFVVVRDGRFVPQ
jgi:branched-chain amino acid transport system substrate-binding protein